MPDGNSVPRARVLVVDDDPVVLDTLCMLLQDEYDVATARSGAEAIALAQDTRSGDIAAVVLDIKMPQMDGLVTAEKMRELLPLTPIIFHTGYPGDYREEDIERSSSPFDYIEKGASSTKLLRSVRNAVENFESRVNQRYIVELAENSYGLIGQSAAMQETYRLIQKVSRTDINVVILGESGTGKELVAHAIHQNSARRTAHIRIMNCNHKPTDLVESELFGYKKGAFTGALFDRRGMFELADGGTIFLDEIGDLSATTQISLLRVLETGEFSQMGPEAEIKKTDVRVICATNRNLEQLVQSGQFREDLYYRLQGATIAMPPLRERREDIPILLNRFLDHFANKKGLPYKILHPNSVSMLINYDWPGNVRQLLKLVESLVVLSDSELIMPEDVQRQLAVKEHAGDTRDASLAEQIHFAERGAILIALRKSGGNITRAAEMLQIDRSNLSKKIKSHGIDVGLLKDDDND